MHGETLKILILFPAPLLSWTVD